MAVLAFCGLTHLSTITIHSLAHITLGRKKDPFYINIRIPTKKDPNIRKRILWLGSRASPQDKDQMSYGLNSLKGGI